MIAFHIDDKSLSFPYVCIEFQVTVFKNTFSFGQMKESIIKELLLISYRCIKYFILQIIFMIFLSFFKMFFIFFLGGRGEGM